jgi:hypothetical protein
MGHSNLLGKSDHVPTFHVLRYKLRVLQAGEVGNLPNKRNDKHAKLSLWRTSPGCLCFLRHNASRNGSSLQRSQETRANNIHRHNSSGFRVLYRKLWNFSLFEILHNLTCLLSGTTERFKVSYTARVCYLSPVARSESDKKKIILEHLRTNAVVKLYRSQSVCIPVGKQTIVVFIGVYQSFIPVA